MSTYSYRLVTVLFNQNFPVPKTSGHLSSSSQGLKVAQLLLKNTDDRNDLNVDNSVIDHSITKKKSPQAYGPPVLENPASAKPKFWQTETRNEQRIKNLKNEYLVALNCTRFIFPTLNEKIIKNKNIYH